MTDFASLGIKIDSSQAKQAVSDLDKLAAVGEKVQQSIVQTENASKKLGKTLSDGAKAARDSSNSIDKYVLGLQKVAATNGLSAREAKLYDLALKGANRSQLEAADAAIRLDEGYKKGLVTGQRLREGFISTAKAAVQLGAALGTAAAGGFVLFNKIADSIAKYQELSEKTGETAQNIASLQPASDASGVALDTVAQASVRLTAALAKTDDESKLVAKGIKALGLNFDEFKKLSPAQQLDAVAKSMSSFAEGSEKSAVAVALFGRSGAELIPFLNDLADQGERQVRLTDEQIKAADDYSKELAKVKGELTAMAQQIVAQSLPAMSDLVGAFQDGVTQALGLGTAADQLKNNNSIGTFAEDGARFLATLLDMADKVVFAFQYVGTSIGAAAAIAASAARGEFAGIGAIIDAAREDGERMLNRPSFADALDRRIADRRQREQQRRQEDRGFTPARPRINAAGLNTDRTKKGSNTAAQEAKAQLAFDLEDIRKAQDALVNTIANGEKLLEARRSANLVTEKAYWEQKRQFLIDNDAAQQAGLEKEIARLQAEKLSGKDKIDNDRKILDAQSKLAKVRENATVNLQVLAIKEKDALDQIRIKFEQAEAAAQSYVDTIARQNERDLNGLGRGNQNREIDARRNQREDQFQARKEQLESQRRANQITSEEYERFLAIEQSAHERSLANDEQYWKKKLEIQGDGIKGAQEGLQNFIDEVNNSFERGNKLVTDGLQGITSSLTDAVWDGDLSSAKDFGDRLGKQILSGIIEQQITKPIAEWLQGSLKDSDSIVSKLLGGLTGTKGSGENWLGALGLGGGASSTGAASAAASTTALASGATVATTALTSLAAAASAAAASMGGSSITSGLGSLFSAGGSAASGFGSGAAFGNMDLGQFFDEGGYTGPGSKYQPAGIVHAGEYVVNAENTRRLGLSFLERLNRRGYADGGFVGSVMGGNLSGGGETTNNSRLEVHNHFAAGTDSKTVDQAARKFYQQLQRSQRNA